MDEVTRLSLHEDVHLDREYLRDRYTRPGAEGTAKLLQVSVEQLAVQIARVERRARLGHRDRMVDALDQVIELADSIGLALLSLVADDVKDCMAGGDTVALNATLARLTRVGELSLGEIWELQGMSV